MHSQRADQVLAKIRAQPTPYFIHLGSIELRIDKNVYPSSHLNEFMAYYRLLKD